MSDYFEHDIKLQPGTKARAEDVNKRFDNVVVGFAKLPAPHATKQGFSGPVAMGDAVDTGGGVTASQAGKSSIFLGIDIGTENAHIINLDIAPVSYVPGQRVAFEAAFGNTGPATINLNGIGIKGLKNIGGSLVAGTYATGDYVEAVYIADGYFQIISRGNDGAIVATEQATIATEQATIATEKVHEINTVQVSRSEIGNATHFKYNW